MEKKIILLILSVAFFSCCAQKPITIDQPENYYASVTGKIYPLKQPNTNDCWATVTTMLYSWRDQKNYKVKDLFKSIGEPWYTLYAKSLGLTSNEKDNFIKEVRFRKENPANYTLLGYKEMLSNYGPLWITTYLDLPGNVKDITFVAHARLLIAIKGPSDYFNTVFVFIDPISGKVKDQNAIDFYKDFEKEARKFTLDSADRERFRNIPFRFQIIHW